MPDCFGEIEEVLMLDLKRMESSGGVIPSMDFSWDAYQQFLSFAIPYELENDILTKETVAKMALYNTPEPDRLLDEIVNFFYEPDCEPKIKHTLKEWN